jgi:hypothetical protein
MVLVLAASLLSASPSLFAMRTEAHRLELVEASREKVEHEAFEEWLRETANMRGWSGRGP